jgi:hypothetical protein
MDVDIDFDGTEMAAEAMQRDLLWLWRGLRRRAPSMTRQTNLESHGSGSLIFLEAALDAPEVDISSMFDTLKNCRYPPSFRLKYTRIFLIQRRVLHANLIGNPKHINRNSSVWFDLACIQRPQLKVPYISLSCMSRRP